MPQLQGEVTQPGYYSRMRPFAILFSVFLSWCSGVLGQGVLNLVTTGTSLFWSMHTDQNCAGPAYDYRFPRYMGYSSPRPSRISLNQCLQNSRGEFFKYTCKIGSKKFSLLESRYSATDSTCSNPLQRANAKHSAILQHDYLCQQDPTVGGFIKIHCGEDAAAAAASPGKRAAIIAPSMQSKADCSVDAPRTRQHILLNVCSPWVENGVLIFHFNLSLSIPTTTPTTTTPTGVSLLLERYDKADSKCSGRIMNRRTISYLPVPSASPGNNPACIKDPLFKGFYYLNEPNQAPYINNPVVSNPGSLSQMPLYMRTTKYASTTCTGTPYLEETTIYNVCVAQKSDTGTITGYYKYRPQNQGNKFDVLQYGVADSSC